MKLTGYQVKQLVAFMGGDYDTDVTIEECPERESQDGEVMPAGLWLWCTDYPEEGCVQLLESEDQ